MNAFCSHVGKDWVRVSIEEFKRLLSGINWRRDAFSDGEVYYEWHTDAEIGFASISRTAAWVAPQFSEYPKHA